MYEFTTESLVSFVFVVLIVGGLIPARRPTSKEFTFGVGITARGEPTP
jgi:hypothetical protein